MLSRIFGIVKYIDTTTDFHFSASVVRDIGGAVIDLSVDDKFKFRRIICGDVAIAVPILRLAYAGDSADGFIACTTIALMALLHHIWNLYGSAD